MQDDEERGKKVVERVEKEREERREYRERRKEYRELCGRKKKKDNQK